MKKYSPILLAAIFSASIGCNTDIDSSEIPSLTTDDTRCSITGGIPFSAEQAKAIETLMVVINTSNCWQGQAGVESLNESCNEMNTFKSLLNETGTKYSVSHRQGLEKIKKSLKGGFLYYHTRTMSDVFQFAADNIGMTTGQKIAYCACDYEFCDDGTACVVDSYTKLPTCSASRYATKTNEKMECDPVLLKNTSTAKYVIASTLPIVKSFKAFNDLETRVVNDEANTISFTNACLFKSSAESAENAKHCQTDDGIGYLLQNDCSTYLTGKKENCEMAQHLYANTFNCLNATESGAGKACYSVPFAVEGLQGPEYSASFFKRIRGYIKALLTADLTINISATDLENAIDEFIISQATLITKAPGNIYTEDFNKILKATDRGDGTLCYKVNESDAECAAIIGTDTFLSGMKNILNALFPNNEPYAITGTTAKTTMPENELRRKLFAYITLGVMPNNAMASSLSTHLQCISIPSAIGDKAGIKRYCSANNDQIVGAKQILNALENSIAARVNLYDALLMGSKATFKVELRDGSVNADGSKKTTLITIDAGATSDIMSFLVTDGTTTKQEYIKGKWLAMKCPSGASCTSASQCGICADSDIPQTINRYDNATEKYVPVYQATCKNGEIVGGTEAKP